MSLIILFSILVWHFLADFMFQTHWMAMNKSTSNVALTIHISVYTAAWIPLATITLGQSALIFFLVTFICHWITDYFTSRWTKKLYAKGDFHNFFVVIGFDQLLHYTQLILTFKLLMI